MSNPLSSLQRLTPSAHGALDYVLLGALALAPALFPAGTPYAATLACYGVFAGYFLLSACTRYSFGLLPAIPAVVHGAIELLLAALLLALPWLAGFADYAVAHSVFVVAGVAALVLAVTTDYDAERDREGPHEPPVDRGAMPPRQSF